MCLYFDNFFWHIAINFCQSLPCQNGATCNQFIGQYNCTCPYGATGVNCQTRMILYLHALKNALKAEQNNYAIFV